MNSQKWGMGSETRRERGAYSPREKGRARSGSPGLGEGDIFTKEIYALLLDRKGRAEC